MGGVRRGNGGTGRVEIDDPVDPTGLASSLDPEPDTKPDGDNREDQR